MRLLIGLQFATVVLLFWTSLVFGHQMAQSGLLLPHALAYLLVLASVWDTARRVRAMMYWLGGTR